MAHFKLLMKMVEKKLRVTMIGYLELMELIHKFFKLLKELMISVIQLITVNMGTLKFLISRMMVNLLWT